MTLKEFQSAINGPKGASEKSIAIFEKELGAKLPADYRKFLLQCNGGSCGGALIFKRNGPSIHHVFGLRSDISLLESLRLQRKGEGPPVPDDLFTIMDNPGGYPICMGWKGKNRSAIFSWGPMSMKRIAASFSDFIKGLREFSEDDDE